MEQTLDSQKRIFWHDIVGHEEEIGRLRRIAKRGRFPHGLIFTGAGGTGKKKVATALGVTLLCEAEDAPCGVCPSCKAMLSGTHPDFYELAPEVRGKSVRLIRIEEIRALRLEAARRPVLSKCRVFLIDDADCLTEESQNSFLKVLEEPPGASFFFLITERPSALLETVRSRSVPMQFGALPQEKISQFLRKQGIENETALAAMCEGSIGRALMLNEQGAMDKTQGAIDFLLGHGENDLLSILSKGEELGKLTREELTEWLRAVNLWLRDGLGKSLGLEDPPYHPRHSEEIARLSEKYSLDKLLRMMQIVAESRNRLNYNVNLRLFAEGFLLKLSKA